MAIHRRTTPREARPFPRSPSETANLHRTGRCLLTLLRRHHPAGPAEQHTHPPWQRRIGYPKADKRSVGLPGRLGCSRPADVPSTKSKAATPATNSAIRVGIAGDRARAILQDGTSKVTSTIDGRTLRRRLAREQLLPSRGQLRRITVYRACPWLRSSTSHKPPLAERSDHQSDAELLNTLLRQPFTSTGMAL